MAGRVRQKKRPRTGLAFHLEDGGLRIRFPKGSQARLYVKESLQAEFGLGAEGPEDLREEISGARAAHAACDMLAEALKGLQEQRRKPDHVVKSAQRAAAFAAGLEQGLLGEHRTIGKDPMHRIAGSVVPPEHKLSGPSHTRGWDLGCAIHAALVIARGDEDPRRQWYREALC